MQVSKSVHMLRLPFTIQISEDVVIDRSVNMFMIAGPAITLVDTGVKGSEEKIFEYLHSIGRDPSEIALIILTHSHPDHIGSALAIRQETGCSIAAHGGEQAWIEDVNLQCQSRPVPGFHTLVGGSVPVDRLLEDGDVLDLGTGHNLDCVVFHTPGHSQGSVSLFLRNEGALLTGDAVPVPGGLPVYDDVLASVQSIRRLISIEGVQVLLSSWDDPQGGIHAYQKMRESLTWLQTIHSIVLREACNCPGDPVALCRRVVVALGLPIEAATPLLVRTFMANLALFDRPQLIVDDDILQAGGGAVHGRDERRLLS